MDTQRQHNAIWIVLLAAGLLVPSLAGAQPQARGLAHAPVDYESEARKAVEDELRESGLTLSDFRIEIAGDPNKLAGHALLHRRLTEPPAGRALLSGRVLDIAWNTVGGVQVFLTSPRDAGAPRSTTTTNSGEFQFPDLTPGDYMLRVNGSPDLKRVTLDEGRKRILVPLGSSGDVYSVWSDDDAHPPMVAARVLRGEEPERYYQIDLTSAPPSVEAVDVPKEDYDSEFGAASVPSATEQKQLSAELAPLLDALFDVGRGPERLKTFISSHVVCRAYYSGERLIPSIDDERCALNMLDSIALGLPRKRLPEIHR